MSHPIIKTADGVLRGRYVKSPLGRSYYSFQGVPYAQPPVGPLRFQPPKQVTPWVGERLALKEGPISISYDVTTTRYMENSSEDCLYLNVYSKDIRSGSAKKPVLFWIHGGGFRYGSGNSDLYGPDFLIAHDIVLITINYRLGALGFLSLMNEACPGNNGLRDQVEALRWVQRNISSFGGDPDNVTIFGESSGASSVQFLMLSPLSRGLFHRAISQSGSALNPWATARYPVECAFKLAEFLGFKTQNKDECLEFLKNVSAKSIAEKSVKIVKAVEPEAYFLLGAFVPVVEPESPDAFLCKPIENLLLTGQLHDVPYMLGVNTLEGIAMFTSDLPPLNTKEEQEKLLPFHPKLKRGTPLADDIVEKIRQFYFPTGYRVRRCADALSAIYFLHGNEIALKGLSEATERKSETYYYYFTYDCGSSFFKRLMGFPGWRGTGHGDDIAMLFYSHYLAPKIKPGSDYERVINQMCQFWVDFAKTGKPTPGSSLWPTYTKEGKEYLELGSTLKTGKNLNEEEIQFWLDIFEQINNSE